MQMSTPDGPRSSAVLVVGDDPMTSRLVRRGLAAAGHPVTESKLTAAGDRLAEPGRHALLVIDLDHSAGRALDLARAGCVVDPALKVLYLCSVPVSVTELDLGDVRWGFLSKPFDIDVLTAHVARLLAD